MEEGEKGRSSNSSFPIQGSPGLRKPNPETVTAPKRTRRECGERPGLLGGGVGWDEGCDPECLNARCQVPWRADCSGQKGVKVSGLIGKLGQPLASRPTRRRKKNKGSSPGWLVPSFPQASARAPRAFHAQRPQRVPCCAPSARLLTAPFHRLGTQTPGEP